jgi:hypothetical protein
MPPDQKVWHKEGDSGGGRRRGEEDERMSGEGKDPSARRGSGRREEGEGVAGREDEVGGKKRLALTDSQLWCYSTLRENYSELDHAPVAIEADLQLFSEGFPSPLSPHPLPSHLSPLPPLLHPIYSLT